MRIACIALLLGLAAGAAGPAAANEPADAHGATSQDYVIGVEDVLRVSVWGEPELSVTGLKVRPDGKITVPLVDDLKVVGLTPHEVRDVVAERLSKYIREPNVTVIVEQINSFRVYFLGEINLQGALNFSKPTRLLQGIAAAGGLTEFSKKEVILLRQEGGSEKRFVINYKQLLAGDPRQENLYLNPGDTLIFP